MTCWDGFGDLADGRPFWVGDFAGDGKSDILFYYPGDRNWWLGRFDAAGVIQWTFAGNTTGFGQVWDGRPFWVGDFAGDGKSDILFYYPGDRNWWLGRFDAAGVIQWNLAGNTTGFGQVWDGRPFWVGDFAGTGKSDILFYYPGDRNWWLGRFDAAGVIQWNLAGNTTGFGQVWDGRPFWLGDFTGDGKRDVLFYYPGDRNWWLGRFSAAGVIQWNLAGNTTGFGQVWDKRPFWVGDFAGDGKTDILFYYPGDRNWWLGRFDAAGVIQWNLAGNTTGFGQVWDGRPFWVGDFAGTGKTDILFYYPGDRNWWLGRFGATGQLTWNLAGNTTGFGQVADGRPFWVGDFTGDGKADILFYYRGDGNWWLGRFGATGQLTWNLAGNTGRPYRSRVRVHVKVLATPTNFTVNDMVDGMRTVYASVGIRLDLGSTETLNLPALMDIETGDCVGGQTTQEQRDLFDHRNNVGANDVAAYLVRTVTSNGNALNGCAAHDGRPSCVVARGATRWTLGHETGHDLGLNHVNDNNRLMTGNGTANITNPPPDLIESERQTMEGSALTVTC